MRGNILANSLLNQLGVLVCFMYHPGPLISYSNRLTAVAAMHDDTMTPTCERANDQRIGAWKALKVLEDNVVLQCGFANRKHMAPFVKVDVQGTHRKFVQVNKGALWFVAAVGGPQLKKEICQQSRCSKN